ncbi:MAG: 50S ribosomal protein L18 [Cryomorphaceae bacterium]|nr:MAG: 50S ribosomal protein L18 [Cryomorphaceae bacterium]
MALSKEQRRMRIKRRSLDKSRGTIERPRLCVFRSNTQFYAQLIDDSTGKTLASCNSLGLKEAQGIAKIEQAKLIGKAMAEKVIAAGFTNVVFDRSGYLYHGRVKYFAEAAREAGLKF